MAIIRDQYKGRTMAKIMSFIMVVFIMVPVLAPSIGQAILIFSQWRAIFVFLLFLAFVCLIWFGFRQAETLRKDKRAEFSFRHIWWATRETLRSRITFGYTVASGFIFGSFIGYLSSAQPILQVLYNLKDKFPFYFGILALSFGVAAYVNARLVSRLGMQKLSFSAATVHIAVSLSFLLYILPQNGTPPLTALITYLLLTFFCFGIMFSNLNSLAIEPLGHIAGIATAIISSLQTFISVSLGTLISRLLRPNRYSANNRNGDFGSSSPRRDDLGRKRKSLVLHIYSYRIWVYPDLPNRKWQIYSEFLPQGGSKYLARQSCFLVKKMMAAAIDPDHWSAVKGEC